MNRLTQLFNSKSEKILNIYFTAGFPELDDTSKILEELQSSGADIVELGIPYSDPLADGLTIQESSQTALKNGISLKKVFEQVKAARESVDIPIVIMGYYNQFLQYGMDRLLDHMKETSIDGIIIPDLPVDHYKANYKSKFEEKDLKISFLITPETSDDRIKAADEESSAFLYVVARSSITGGKSEISDEQKAYFDRIENMDLNSPKLIGFGIHDNKSFNTACEYAEGAIIGSAFIRLLKNQGISEVNNYIKDIKS